MNNSDNTNATLEVDELLGALDDNTNHSILSMTDEKIEDIKRNILEEIGVSQSQKEFILDKLKGYMYVNELPDLREGFYVRWISLKNPDKIHLTRGAYISEINITKKGTTVVMKNMMNIYMQIPLDEALVFRKLNNEERLLLSAMNYLNT